MHIDTMPQKITAKAIKDSIFTGKKYLFAYYDYNTDCSWDGEKTILDFNNKSISVLFSKEELEKFAPSEGVHEFLLRLKEVAQEELKRLKKPRQARFYKDKLTGNKIDMKEIRDKRIEFLTKNDIRFFEINFE